LQSQDTVVLPLLYALQEKWPGDAVQEKRFVSEN
jgi:hypothetical protein